jgi:hypothetical protein
VGFLSRYEKILDGDLIQETLIASQDVVPSKHKMKSIPRCLSSIPDLSWTPKTIGYFHSKAYEPVDPRGNDLPTA